MSIHLNITSDAAAVRKSEDLSLLGKSWLPQLDLKFTNPVEVKTVLRPPTPAPQGDITIKVSVIDVGKNPPDRNQFVLEL